MTETTHVCGSLTLITDSIIINPFFFFIGVNNDQYCNSNNYYLFTYSMLEVVCNDNNKQ